MSAATTPLPALHAAAEAHAARGDFDAAIAVYQQAWDAGQQHPAILLQLSYLYSLAGRYRLAHAHACRAHASPALRADLLPELIPRLRTFNEIPALLALAERMGPLDRIPIPLLLTLASHLTYANLPQQAIAYLDEARRGDPDYPPTLLARGQVLIYLGRFDEAGTDIARALKRAPELAQGYWLQAALRRQTPQSHHIDALRRELARPGRRPIDIALLQFALHKELDDLGDHDAAWQALAAGCAAKRATLDYAAARDAAIFDALERFAPSAVAPPAEPPAPPCPIFIVGMHRSGTSLLEQMLDGSPEVMGIGELYDFTSAMRHATDHHCRGVIDLELVRRAAHADLSAAGRRYLQGTRWRLGDERCFTDKLPSNFLNIGFIAQALPQAKILHMVRDPRETCFSNLRELFSEANPYSYALDELGAFQRGYRRLMRHWHATLPGRILDVDYARLVREPESTLREVAAFSGIDYTPAMPDIGTRRRAVVTASAVQVRAAPASPQQPKWTAYARQLAPLFAQLDG